MTEIVNGIRDDVDDFIAFLNGLLETDPEFMQEFCNRRVGCNEALADHPTVQVHVGPSALPGEREPEGRPTQSPRAGFIGVMNGFFGAYHEGERAGWGAIAMILDNAGRIERFVRVPVNPPSKSQAVNANG